MGFVGWESGARQVFISCPLVIVSGSDSPDGGGLYARQQPDAGSSSYADLACACLGYADFTNQSHCLYCQARQGALLKRADE
ncbi:hypothetical protein D9M71_752870 [compost metagenome]